MELKAAGVYREVFFRSDTVIEQYRRDYNETRPHSSLGYLTPHEWKASRAI